MTPETMLIARARPHEGVFTTADAFACGVSQRMLDGQAERGEIVRVHRSVYRFAHIAVTPTVLLRAALAAAKGNAVASHSSAAMLLGLGHVPLGTPEITVTSRGGRARRLDRVRVHTSRRLPPEDQTRVRGTPCTTGSRTLIDLCPRFPDATNIARADQAICSGIAARHILHARAAALSKGRRGVHKLADITAPDADGTFWSALERTFGAKIRQHRLPVPEYNAPIDIAGRRYYADALWGPQRLVAELHGLAFHTRPTARARDDERTNAFTGAGLRLLVFRWDDVMYNFDHVADVVRRTLDDVRAA